MVAGVARPSNVPVNVSLLPASTAVTVPDPVIVAAIVRSIGTGDRRVLNVLLVCACGETAHRRTAAAAIIVIRIAAAMIIAAAEVWIRFSAEPVLAPRSPASGARTPNRPRRIDTSPRRRLFRFRTGRPFPGARRPGPRARP